MNLFPDMGRASNIYFTKGARAKSIFLSGEMVWVHRKVTHSHDVLNKVLYEICEVANENSPHHVY